MGGWGCNHCGAALICVFPAMNCVAGVVASTNASEGPHTFQKMACQTSELTDASGGEVKRRFVNSLTSACEGFKNVKKSEEFLVESARGLMIPPKELDEFDMFVLLGFDVPIEP